jgi:hypothetical protein
MQVHTGNHPYTTKSTVSNFFIFVLIFFAIMNLIHFNIFVLIYVYFFSFPVRGNMEYILVDFFIFFSCNVTDFFGLYIYFGFAAAGHYVDVGVYVTVIFVCVCVFFFLV